MRATITYMLWWMARVAIHHCDQQSIKFKYNIIKRTIIPYDTGSCEKTCTLYNSGGNITMDNYFTFVELVSDFEPT